LVRSVNLFTRLIADPKVSPDYARSMQEVRPGFRIVRLQCGGRKYLRKEQLWPHLDEYINRAVKTIKRSGEIPDIVHGHYPDAGYVAMELSRIFGVPFIYTGHSMGRSKRRRLAEDGMRQEEMNRRYRIDHRIQVEEDIMACADLVVASTNQEVKNQYGQYRNGKVPEFKVIPPGIDIARFYPYYHDLLSDGEGDERARYAQALMIQQLGRFFVQPDKPLILALCRPDKRKNISGLIRAFGEDAELRTMANLAIFAGIRKDIDDMEENERDVLTRMLLLMDKYDLYGKMAIPKKHDAEYEVPALYRIAAEKKGVFVNTALTEPFGLTLLEASAVGVPIVATCNGGPNDIVENCANGILVDPTDSGAIAAAIRTIITDADQWERFSKNGLMNVRKHYTWESHAETYVEYLARLRRSYSARKIERGEPADPVGRRLVALEALVVSDIDNTLIGEDNSELAELADTLKRHRQKIGFAVATGRTVQSAAARLEEYGLPKPDVLITSVGAEIYYGPQLMSGQGWATHIAKGWERGKIVDLLKGFDFLEYQEKETQRKFKVSYYMEPDGGRLREIHHWLVKHKCRFNLIYSHDRYVDILPWRASKGKALRYLSYKWEVPLANILVCGDSGNDEEMLRGEPRAVVVGNHTGDLDHLKGRRSIYFAKKACAGGILEGIRHYRFLERIDRNR